MAIVSVLYLSPLHKHSKSVYTQKSIEGGGEKKRKKSQTAFSSATNKYI